MGLRNERLSGEVRHLVADLIIRGEIRDPAVRSAGLVTITRVEVSGDLRHARVFFTVHDADEKRLLAVAAGLGRAAGFVSREVGRKLGTKVVPQVEFAIDRAFEGADRVLTILRDLEDEKARGGG